MTTSHSDPRPDPHPQQHVVGAYYPNAALSKAYEIGLDREFIAWLSENWVLWGEFVSLAAQVIGKGRTRWSADAICHVLRWNRLIRDSLDPTFKINNNRTAGLGRLFNACHGVDFFETRRLHKGREVLGGNL